MVLLRVPGPGLHRPSLGARGLGSECLLAVPSVQVLEMFILVLQQCHKESEDKWKRLSRQIADIILPMLARQQVCPPPPACGVTATPWKWVKMLVRGGRLWWAFRQIVVGAFYGRYWCRLGECGARGRDFPWVPRRPWGSASRAASFPAYTLSPSFCSVKRLLFAL